MRGRVLYNKRRDVKATPHKDNNKITVQSINRVRQSVLIAVLYFMSLLFPDTGTLQMELGLTQFEAGDMAPLWEDTVDGAVTYQSTFREIHRWAVLHAVEGCQEGETRQPVDGRMEFKRCWITWDRYEFYFYGRSGKTKAAGFRFAFPK